MRHAVISALFLSALLATGAAAAETKIATIRASDLVQQSPQYKSAQARMKGEFEKRQSELQEQGKRLDDDVKKFQRDADTLSPEQRSKAEKDLFTRKNDLEFAARKLREDAQSRERELTVELMGKLRDTISAVAKEKSIDVVLQDPVYAVPALDITEEVLKRLAAAK